MAQPALKHAKRAHGFLKDWTPVLAAVTTIVGAVVLATEKKQDDAQDVQMTPSGVLIVGSPRRFSLLGGLLHYIWTLAKVLLGFALVSFLLLVWLKSDPSGKAVETTLLVCLSLGLAFARER